MRGAGELVTVWGRPEMGAVRVPSMVVRVRGGEHFPDWELGFAWDSLLGGIPPMFLEVCASCVECWGCRGAGNECVEVIDIA